MVNKARGTATTVTERKTKKEAEEECKRQQAKETNPDIKYVAVKALTSQVKQHWSQKRLY